MGRVMEARCPKCDRPNNSHYEHLFTKDGKVYPKVSVIYFECWADKYKWVVIERRHE